MIVEALKAEKINSDPGDSHQDGTICYIIAETAKVGSILMYLALFEDATFPVAVTNIRIKLLDNIETENIVLNEIQKGYIKQLPANMFKLYEKSKKQEKE